MSPERALLRRNLVLRLMRDQGRIADEDYRTAAAKPVWEANRAERFREAEEWVNTVPIEVAPLPDTLIEDARRRQPRRLRRLVP